MISRISIFTGFFYFLAALFPLSFSQQLHGNAPANVEEKYHDLPNELVDELRKAEEAGGDSRFSQEFSNMLSKLAIVLAVIFALLWVLKKMVVLKAGQANKDSSIKILESRTVSPKTTIYLLNVFDKTVAVAESTNGIQVIAEHGSKEVLHHTDSQGKPA